MQTNLHLCFPDSWCIYLHESPSPPFLPVCVSGICILLLAPPALFWMPSCVICSSSHLEGVPLVYHNFFYFFYSAVFLKRVQGRVFTRFFFPCFSFFLSPSIVIILGFSFIYVSLHTQNRWVLCFLFCTLSLEFYSYPTPAFRSYSNLP